MRSRGDRAFRVPGDIVRAAFEFPGGFIVAGSPVQCDTVIRSIGNIHVGGNAGDGVVTFHTELDVVTGRVGAR